MALGWLAHFSPFTEQTPQYIYRAYEAPAVGWLAVAWLAALLLVLIITAIYAGVSLGAGLALTFSRDARSPVDWKSLA